MSGPVELERLLQDDHWLRRLARRLTGDAQTAEDLAQDAWVAALAAGRSDRPWLFGVLRNLRRARRRECAREDALRSLPRPEDVPATDEIVDELVLRKRITDGLLELPEPWRTTLTLRFVHDQRLAAIARRTGVAVSTVHERIAHGLELLRRRLDVHYDGRRRAWAVGLLTLAKPGGLAATLGGLIVGTSTKLAGAAVILLGALLWLRQERSPAPRGIAEVPLEVASGSALDAKPPELVEARGAAERDRIAPRPSEAPTERATALPATLEGLLLDLDGVRSRARAWATSPDARVRRARRST